MKRADLLLLLLPLSAGAFFRFYRVECHPLWLDEITTILLCNKGLAGILENLTCTHHAPPLFYFLLYFASFLGESEFVYRLPSVIFGIAAIPFMYFVGKALFGRAVGFGGAILLALSSFHLTHSQEARMYSLLLFSSLVSYHGFLRILRGEGRGAYLEFGVGLAISLYSHYLFVFVILTQGVTFVLLRVFFKPVAGGIPARKRIFFMAVTLASVAIVFVPWIPFLFQRVKTPYTPFKPFTFERLHWEFLYANLQRLWTDTHWMNLILGFFFVWGASWGVWKQRRETLFSLLWGFLPLVSVISFILFYGTFFAPRYIIFVLPPWLFLVCLGVERCSIFLISLSGNLLRVQLPRVVFILFFILFLVPVSGVQLSWALRERQSGMGWETDKLLAEEIARNFQENDRVIFFCSHQNQRLQDIHKICSDYYLDKLTGKSPETYSFTEGGIFEPLIVELLAPILSPHERRWVVFDLFQEVASRHKEVVTFREVFSTKGRIWAAFGFDPTRPYEGERFLTPYFQNNFEYRRNSMVNLGTKQFPHKGLKDQTYPERILVLYSLEERHTQKKE